jgi:hypothetical protein
MSPDSTVGSTPVIAAGSVHYTKRVPLPLHLPSPGIDVLECYFEPSLHGEHADVFACLFHAERLEGWRSYEGATRLIWLGEDIDSIFRGIDKSTRYEINRAGSRDGVDTGVTLDPTEQQLDEFMGYYDEFARSKGVPLIRRPQIRALRAANMVAISTARLANGEILAAHAYLVTSLRARLSHSASLFRLQQRPQDRAQVGRANRLLHWRDLLHFQELRLAAYDFGGWYLGSADESLLRINAFKKEFGGQIIREWSSFRAGSAIGSLYLALRDMRLRRNTDA